MSYRSWIALSLCTLFATPSFADFRHEETTQITGGTMVAMMKLAGSYSKDAKKAMDPVTSTVPVKCSAFEDELQTERAEHRRPQEGRGTGYERVDPKVWKEAADQQSAQTGSLAMTNDMWLVPEIPGYSEVRDFNQRAALKIGMVFGDLFKPSMAAMPAGSCEGMAAMVKEMSKLKGVPVMQVMRMGSTANGEPLPAASEAPLPASNGPATPRAGDVAKQSTSSAIAAKPSGFGGFGRKKKDTAQDQPAPDQSQSGQTATSTQSVLMESSTQLTSFSSASLDSSQFDVPAGYAQVAAESKSSNQ